MLYPNCCARTFFSFVLLLLLWPAAAFAQGTETTGTVKGRVFDTGADNQGVAGATVILRNEETGLMRTVKTSTDGSYSFALLSPGTYMISASHPNYEEEPPNSTINRFTVFIARDNVVKPPPIRLRPKGSGTPTTTTPPVNQPQPPTQPPNLREEPTTAGQLVNLSSAARGGNFDQRQLTSLPLPGIRTFDTLALLLPGVALPPQPIGNVVGPGLGAGIGSAGQFSVNGQRARSNNFTVDGSDNNDEDIGVRRQGFVSLVPQNIESVQDFQISTQVWDAGMGRNLGSQVNAVSRSGGNLVHGAVYDFFNHDALNARNFFDYTSEKAPSYQLFATRPDGSKVPILVDGRQVIQNNPAEGKDKLHRNQGGVAIGVPFSKKYFGPLGSEEPKTFFFGSFERQDISARQETHFSVPTVAQRGFLNSGASRLITIDRDGQRFNDFPTSLGGDAVFSLFPLPNNHPDQPAGPFGPNTFTQVLPANANGTIFSLKLDHNFKFLGPEKALLTVRYNFTNDRRQIPAVGGAVFSSVEPKVGTQNLSLFLNDQLSASVANQLRGSYGRTRLRFNPLGSSLPDPLGDPFLRSSRLAPNDPFNSPFLLNARRLLNSNTPGGQVVDYRRSTGSPNDTEFRLGTIGQVIVTPFSPVGLDVYLFPQARTNNTYQIADTLSYFRGNHTLKFGADLRRTQLNSRLDRNFRPQVIFSGGLDVTSQLDRLFPSAGIPFPNLSRFGPTPGFFTGSDMAAIGLATGFFQALSIGAPDSTIGLRLWQYDFFVNHNWRVRRGLTLDYGLRYEYNTVPREVNNRIEKTFSAALPDVDPVLNSSTRTQRATNAFGASIAALNAIIGGRKMIYEPDRNNFGPHFGFAWDPFASSSTQAGKTAVRSGVGIYYDVILGNVVSQSRNVFPTFVPFNVDASILLNGGAVFGVGGFDRIFTPSRFDFNFFDNSGNRIATFPFTQGGTLNVIGFPPGAIRPFLGATLNTLPARDFTSGNGLGFTLPDRNLRTPYTLHFNFQVERELFKDYLVNIAYVGSRGVKLTRFRTPNGGVNSPTLLLDPFGTLSSPVNNRPVVVYAVPPLSNLNLSNLDFDLGFGRITRPMQGLGAYTTFDSSASSIYHSLQASVTKRFSGGREITAAYTWSHAIDDVSDVFDLAGAFSLPQDNSNLRAERGNANFDLRHRFVFSSVSNVPFISRFTGQSGAKGVLLGGWQFASISTIQTGQPFTVNTSFDVNLDGNLTDRPNTTNGLTVTDSRQQRLILNVAPTSLLATPTIASNGQVTPRDGAVGRNTFRAGRIINTDFTLIKNFRVKEGHDLVLRAEAFNLLNRAQFGIPVRILEASSFGRAVNTVLPARQVQFALKYVF